MQISTESEVDISIVNDDDFLSVYVTAGKYDHVVEIDGDGTVIIVTEDGIRHTVMIDGGLVQ
jgi:archaellum component FlaG (FlaF/FlaG flagellin family)